MNLRGNNTDTDRDWRHLVVRLLFSPVSMQTKATLVVVVEQTKSRRASELYLSVSVDCGGEPPAGSASREV